MLPGASLLLNLEGLATMGIAWLVFRENVDRRLLLGAFAILAGAALLSWQGKASLDWGAGLSSQHACGGDQQQHNAWRVPACKNSKIPLKAATPPFGGSNI